MSGRVKPYAKRRKKVAEYRSIEVSGCQMEV